MDMVLHVSLNIPTITMVMLYSRELTGLDINNVV